MKSRQQNHPYELISKPEWRQWVTPIPLKKEPIHRWYYFPHSFTESLVDALIQEWGLKDSHYVLDPFCGAGTTLLAAKRNHVPAQGYDLSPLSVLATHVKTANYSLKRLREAWTLLQDDINPGKWNGPSRIYPSLVRKALPGKLLGAFDALAKDIEALPCSTSERDFFRLSLLSTLPSFSRAKPTGGWLSWIDNRATSRGIITKLSTNVETMFADLEGADLPRLRRWNAEVADARDLPDRDATYSAVITSPPYPNRHDYTRVFGVELMFGFLNWSQTRQLRYQSFYSHPESKPKRPDFTAYIEPTTLSHALKTISVKKETEERIPKMLRGYFIDMFLCLKEAARVCKANGRVAFVVGNAQYYGVPIMVDELTAEIGEQVGLKCQKLISVRYRGNSAQQMGAFGRHPSRESIVIFQRK